MADNKSDFKVLEKREMNCLPGNYTTLITVLSMTKWIFIKVSVITKNLNLKKNHVVSL